MKVRKNHNLNIDAAGLLDRQSNASAYLSALVATRNRIWQNALDSLQQEGWSASEILCACDLLNGVWQLIDDPREIGPTLKGADPAVLDKWGSDNPPWIHGCAPKTALALYQIVSEYWAGNSELIELLKQRKGD